MKRPNGEPIGLTQKQLAAKMGVSPQTLYDWRSRNCGPPYFKVQGYIYYRAEDVDAWIDSGKIGNSTSSDHP